ncbi:hypothetical protein [Bartonella sp. MU70NMGDW]|uniref:hypothetical protein n=1 Tax=Bartonella sp. MU70NMGDW TaxID=3243561 RepID=UPI0035D126DB
MKHKDQNYEGRHSAIIDMDTWNEVRVIREREHHQPRRNHAEENQGHFYGTFEVRRM